MTDAELVRHLQAGAAQAFKVLFERHVLSIRRFLGDVLRDPSAADDATQEVFARAHVQLSKLGPDDHVRGWLFGVARNVAFESRRVRAHEELDETAGIPDAVLPAPDPEAVLLDRELQRHFSEALDALSVNRRAVLVMRVDHGLSYEDIAKAMGWSLPMVKNEIHRARLLLRARLAPHLRGAP